MTITIRRAGRADLPALLGLYSELHPEDPPVAAGTAPRVWREITAQPGRTILVAELDAVVVGTVDCTVLANLTRGAQPFMLIENVVVADAFRRKGVGTRLLAAAVDLADAAGCYKAQLLSRGDRSGAHAFYESCGFAPSARGYRRYRGVAPGRPVTGRP